jgi:DNA-binding IclR family transcriptional regulator
MQLDKCQGSSVLERGLRILESFSPERTYLTLAEITRKSALPKPTAYRLANQLVSLGVLERVGTGYRPGCRLFKISISTSSEWITRTLALPFLENLHEATGAAVHFGLRAGLSVLYVERVSRHQTDLVARGEPKVGMSRPLHCTATGKAMLAFSPPRLFDDVVAAGLSRRTPGTIVQGPALAQHLRSVARTGVAFDREEFCPGLTSVASPVFDAAGAAIGAIEIVGPAGQFQPNRFAESVRVASVRVSREINRSGSAS